MGVLSKNAIKIWKLEMIIEIKWRSCKIKSFGEMHLN
jgi:hypothetical protein